MMIYFQKYWMMSLYLRETSSNIDTMNCHRSRRSMNYYDIKNHDLLKISNDSVTFYDTRISSKPKLILSNSPPFRSHFWFGPPHLTYKVSYDSLLRRTHGL